MTRRFIFAALASVITMALFAGCAGNPNRKCWRPFQSTCPNRCAPPPCAGCPGGQFPPPGAIPGAPVPTGVAPAGVGGLPPTPEPTPSNIPGGVPSGAYNPGPGAAIPNPEDVRRYGPSTSEYTWQSPNPGVRLSGPEASVPVVPRDNVRLQSPEPPAAQPGVAVPPVTIPSFAVVVPDRIISGQKPTLDGLDWLRQNGYRTVVQVVKAGEKESARKAVESRGLKYQSVEVALNDLTKAVDEFNRILADNGNYPLFVYDRDGSLAGALWYIRFRAADGLNAAEALNRAKSLGLREESTGDNAILWGAIQTYLSKSGR